MSGEPKTLTLTPGRRYLIREGSWTAYLEEVRVVARSKTGVYIEHESGNRRWHLLAYAGVGKWVIEEDLGPWNPHEARDEAAELRERVEELTGAVRYLRRSLEDLLAPEVLRNVMNAYLWSDLEQADKAIGSARVSLAASDSLLRRLAGGENEK